MDESEDEAQNPLSEENWMKQNISKFIKYVIHHRHPMTPEQLKQKPFQEIFKNHHEKVDTDEGESTKVQEEFTTSEGLTQDEYSTFSDMSKQDSEFDINVHDTQDEQNSQTPETLQNNTTIHDKDNLIHDEYNTSENENTIEIETFEHYGENILNTEESIPVETSQVLTVFNKAIHHEDDSSDDKSEIEIEPPKENGEQENIEFTLYELKCTIDAILQHMGFYHTTENPCVMMRENHKTKSRECIIIHQDQLYIASSTLQEILHILKNKYKIKIDPNNYLESNFPYDPGGTIIC